MITGRQAHSCKPRKEVRCRRRRALTGNERFDDISQTEGASSAAKPKSAGSLAVQTFYVEPLRKPIGVPESPRIWGDFNGLDHGYVPLDAHGSARDLGALGEAAKEGLSIIVYDDQCEADAVLEWHGREWCARVVSAIRYI